MPFQACTPTVPGNWYPSLVADLHYLRYLLCRRGVYDEKEVLGGFGLVRGPVATSVVCEVRLFGRDVLLPYYLDEVCPCGFHV